MVDATGFEEQLVLQSRVRINAGLTLLALGVYTQLALVLKKKQFERGSLGCRYSSRRLELDLAP